MVFTNNCNHFSNELVRFLTGSTIPTYFTDLTYRTFYASPRGWLFGSFLIPRQKQIGSFFFNSFNSGWFAAPD